MSLERVRRRLVDRLEEGDRGNRGWFVITRVHVALSWLKGIAEYLENRGGDGYIRLTEQDYQRLATITDTDRHDPGVQLRRHHLLVMDKPLQLLRRADRHRWNRIALTDLGRDLAYTDDPAPITRTIPIGDRVRRRTVGAAQPGRAIRRIPPARVRGHETGALVLRWLH